MDMGDTNSTAQSARLEVGSRRGVCECTDWFELGFVSSLQNLLKFVRGSQRLILNSAALMRTLRASMEGVDKVNMY